MRNRNATDRTNLRHYRTGDDGLDDLIEALATAGGRTTDLDLIAELLVTSTRLGRENVDRGE
ncbi:MAG TPA: hypothetical protein EYM46_05395, partial [Acidimicrobiia bacterium]|nr:hypothetical protein [Acidimicrobiia bacterium]